MSTVPPNCMRFAGESSRRYKSFFNFFLSITPSSVLPPAEHIRTLLLSKELKRFPAEK